MRLLVRLSLPSLVALVTIGFALTQWVQTDSNPTNSSMAVSVLEGQCKTDGVSLLVDFGSDSERETIEKCIKNYSDTSWYLFEAAGLSVTGTSKYPIGFVCRIQGFPEDKNEKCQDMPNPAVGSWAYFVANEETSQWQYSTWGAANHRPTCGTAEAWIFKLPSEDLEEPPLREPETIVCAAN
ncbi:MAG: hypothetical protein RJA78_872 [Actinomycetota bacterium]